jgi:hypothetical protein
MHTQRLLRLLWVLHHVDVSAEIRVRSHVRVIRDSLMKTVCSQLHQPVFERLQTSLPLRIFLFQTANALILFSIVRFESMELDFEVVRSTAHASVEAPAFGELRVGSWRGVELIRISCIGETRRGRFHHISTRSSISGDLTKMRGVAGHCDAVHTAKVFVQILLARKAFAGVSLAFRDCASELLLGTAVFAVDLALVAQQSSRVCEALEFRALSLWATVRTIVLVHVFATEKLVRVDTIKSRHCLDSPPLALSVEVLVGAFRTEIAIVFAVVSLRRIAALDRTLHLVPCVFYAVW